ncbi:hypothetical protein [Pelagerythrobacter sp.]|uniref:hypothetical protein n=1 Tax=Pelagerythrobacter sp. TaxID=2800702 RepID=UPI0035B24094
MGKWAERAREIANEDERANSAISAKSPSNGTIGTNGTGALVPMPRNPAVVLREWHARLSAIDQFAPPPGWSLNDWLTITDDACWLYENHAGYAVRNGWSDEGLFGVRIGMAHAGGLAQFLRSSRQLLFDGGVAHVVQFGVTSRRNRTCGRGLPVLWEL